MEHVKFITVFFELGVSVCTACVKKALLLYKTSVTSEKMWVMHRPHTMKKIVDEPPVLLLFIIVNIKNGILLQKFYGNATCVVMYECRYCHDQLNMSNGLQ